MVLVRDFKGIQVRMACSLSRSIALLSAFVALVLSDGASAQSTTPADKRLADFIQLNQFASPYRGALIPEQWCYSTRVDSAYSWWYLEDPTSGLIAIQVRSSVRIPFTLGAYGSTGALVVGYVIDGGTPKADLDPVASFTPNLPPCAIGMRILVDGPFPIAGMARNLGAQTAFDPAHEYRIWPMKDSFHRVRMIAAIPAAFQVGMEPVAGRVILGFTSDW